MLGRAKSGRRCHEYVLALDPKLSDEAHAFARSLEDAAKKAADLEKSIQADTGINTIIQDNAKAQHTLFELSAGLKDVGANASSADGIEDRVHEQIPDRTGFEVNPLFVLGGMGTNRGLKAC
ncbi:hypothetical protein [Mesorhizobium japonicum]|uniref:hypothetical protein n=1 Tax=Mesorhizobium japonicum TaxID=2066070 RepID=UPI0005C8BBAE|nr:hypothetical protein [Mesorhizobium japonicum]